jgi:hypothetical protein
MKTYLVRWEIDIEADSPEEAAARALMIQRDNDPANTATVFDVAEPGTSGLNTPWKRVDARDLTTEELERWAVEKHSKAAKALSDPIVGRPWIDGEWRTDAEGAHRSNEVL